MAGRVLGMIPGVDLLRQAWDATKLAGAIMRHRRERAVVLASERRDQLTKYRGAEANKKLKQLFQDKEYSQMVRLYLPNVVVQTASDLMDVWFKVWDVYWIFVVLRILLVMMPQTGYIHPDEHFQSVEVLVGDIFHTDTVRTWEFNVTAPLRSITIPYVLIGTPLYLLKALDYFLFTFTNYSLVGPYTVLIVPRLSMLLLSFVMDWCVYQICILYKHSYNQCLTTLASSYVMLIYATRTFSNTIEMALMSVLLYLVAHCMQRSTETIYLLSLVQEAYDKAQTVPEKVTIRKRNKLIPPHDFKHCLLISVICGLGVFNRPTFVVFAAVPLFFWFQRGIANDSYFTPFQMFNFRMLSLLPGFVVTCLLLLLTDSLYYGDLTLRKLWDLSMDWSDWKCAPFHFVMYNVVPDNVRQHGSHPVYLHALINMPLLFGPLGVAALVSTLHFFSEMVSNKWNQKPNVRSVYAMNMFSVVVSIAALSLFPHQEPRFLLPLTLPIVLMNAHHLRRKYQKIANWRPLLCLWYSFNLLAVIVFGFMHQAGIQQALSFMAKQKNLYSDKNTEVTFIFSHTYMPPQFPLLLPKKPHPSGNYPGYYHQPSNVNLKMVDLAGKPLADDVRREMISLASRSRKSSYKKYEQFIVLPAHLIRDLEDVMGHICDLKAIVHFFPHLGLDSLPSMDPVGRIHQLLHPSHSAQMSETLEALTSDIWDSIAQFSLSIYKFELFHDVKWVELASSWNITTATSSRMAKS